MRRHRTASGVLAGIVAVGLVLSGVVGAAARVPSTADLGTAQLATAPDYTSTPGLLAPLADGFVERVLGLPALSQSPEPVMATAEPVLGPTSPPSAAPTTSTAATPARPDARPSSPAGAVPNDTPAEAAEIDRIPFEHAVNARAAGRGPDDPATCGPVGSTVWYRWTPTEDVRGIVQALSPGRVVNLAAYSGEPGAFTQVACDTDPTGHASLVLDLPAQQTTWLQLTGAIGLTDVTLLADVRGFTRAVGAPRIDVGERGPIRTALAADGRWAVESTMDQLDDLDTDDGVDIYLHDLETGEIRLVSANVEGEKAGATATPNVDISADGRHVVYASWATNLTGEPDTNDAVDVFVWDRLTGLTQRVSVWSDGREGEPRNSLRITVNSLATPHDLDYRVSISDDGQRVAFDTTLTLSELDGHSLLAPHPAGDGPPNQGVEVHAYVHDRGERTTRYLMTHADGTPADDWYNSARPALSGDGSAVAFETDAPLDSDADHDHLHDIYVVDLDGPWRPQLVTVPLTEDSQDHGQTGGIDLSHDGQVIAFTSTQADLVDGDDNGLPDVFARDRRSPHVELISVSAAGTPATGSTDGFEAAGYGRLAPSISDDGRHVAFISAAPDLDGQDEARGGATVQDGAPDEDAFVRDRLEYTTTMVSLADDGSVPDSGTILANISGDGTTVLLVSGADLSGDGQAHTSRDPEMQVRRGASATGLYLHVRGR